MPYSQITSFERGEKRSGRSVTLHAGPIAETVDVRVLGDKYEGYDYQKHHQEALLLILTRKTRSEPAMAPDRAS